MPSTLDDVMAALKRIEAKLDAKPATAKASVSGVPLGGIADDRELDSDKGDRKVKHKPDAWAGEDMRGRLYSECPPDFLDLLADMLDGFAAKNAKAGEADKAKYDAKDAARCRGWARRKRATAETAPLPPAPSDTDLLDDELPF